MVSATFKESHRRNRGITTYNKFRLDGNTPNYNLHWNGNHIVALKFSNTNFLNEIYKWSWVW